MDIHNRINENLDEEMSDTQFGFRHGLSTPDALFELSYVRYHKSRNF